MANHISHAGLPYPIRGARYTIDIPYLDADGDPTDPTTPDTECSIDGAAFADCAEEVTTRTGGNGSGYLTLSGAETDCSSLVVCAKVASGPKATLIQLNPRILPQIAAGTAQAGDASTITLAALTGDDDFTGCIIKTTGGTGGGGTGGANNQARIITSYNTATKVATVTPNWEVNPSSDTTYSILSTEIIATTDMEALATAIVAEMDVAAMGANIAAIVNNNSKFIKAGPLYIKV